MPVARAWELLAVDYGSADGRNECLQAWPRRDPRIHVGIIDRNRCPAAARNAALRRARGEFIAYLDPGDEYYPNYLAEVVAAAQESDVLLFGFDIACENGSADGRPTAWEPGRVIDRLFAENIVPPWASPTAARLGAGGRIQRTAVGVRTGTSGSGSRGRACASGAPEQERTAHRRGRPSES